MLTAADTHLQPLLVLGSGQATATDKKHIPSPFLTHCPICFFDGNFFSLLSYGHSKFYVDFGIEESSNEMKSNCLSLHSCNTLL